MAMCGWKRKNKKFYVVDIFNAPAFSLVCMCIQYVNKLNTSTANIGVIENVWTRKKKTSKLEKRVGRNKKAK